MSMGNGLLRVGAEVKRPLSSPGVVVPLFVVR